MLNVYTGNIIPENIVDGVYFPCGNMHPDDIVEYAQKLVLIGANYNINIITYNPMLIEGIDAWSEYYKVEDKVEFYLDNKPVTRYMGERMMYEIYDNLGNAYDIIDNIRASILFRC